MDEQLQAVITARPLKTVTRSQSPEAENSYLSLPVKTVKIPKQIPLEFKGQYVWKNLINPPLNQGSCGSCWAFATTGALGDRWNILTNGAQKVTLSPVKPVLCDWQGEEDTLENPDSPYFEELFWKFNQDGIKAGSCFGNTLTDAWRYLYISGTNTLECLPYSLRGGYDTPLDEVTDSRKIPLCYDVTGKIGDMCADNVYHSTTGLETGTPARFYRAKEIYRIQNNPASIQAEILTNGPVTTGIDVYPSFYTFDAVNDVYKTDGNETSVGGHAVEIVGWGSHPSQGDFWWIKNSWGCYDKFTRVLTESGWRYFFDLELGELVATLNPQREIEYWPIEALYCYRHRSTDPPLHVWNTDEVDLCVTHNHRMLIPHSDGTYSFKESWEAMDSSMRVYRSCERFHGGNPSEDFSDEYLTILTAFILDGYKRREYTTECLYDPVTTLMENLSDERLEYVIYLPKLKGLQEALRNLPTTVNSKNIIVRDETLYHRLPKFGGRIPREILELSTEYLLPFFGKIFGGKQRIYVNRSSLAGDIQELAIKSGSSCTVTPRRNKYRVELVSPVAHCDPAQLLMDYTGCVYCVTVQNSCILVQRGGKMAWSGNSDWGDKGYFRIRRGTNECGVESNVMAGLPDFFETSSEVASDSNQLKSLKEFRDKIDSGENVVGKGINPATGYSRRVERMQWPIQLDTTVFGRVGELAAENTGSLLENSRKLDLGKTESGTIYIIIAVFLACVWLAIMVWVLTRK